jgi:hypothetical protein
MTGPSTHSGIYPYHRKRCGEVTETGRRRGKHPPGRLVCEPALKRGACAGGAGTSSVAHPSFGVVCGPTCRWSVDAPSASIDPSLSVVSVERESEARADASVSRTPEENSVTGSLDRRRPTRSALFRDRGVIQREPASGSPRAVFGLRERRRRRQMSVPAISRMLRSAIGTQGATTRTRLLNVSSLVWASLRPG